MTLLLTDVEEGNRSRVNDPRAMSAGVARCRAIVGEAIDRHGGVQPVEQAGSASVVGVFSDPSDALAAAVEAQCAFRAERWPATKPVRVRIALDTAESRWRADENDVAWAVNRGAGLRAIALGGQILVSRAVRELVVDRMPREVQLVDLGVHRLRDLGRSEHVFAATHPELSGDLGPLRSLDAFPNNLPDQLTTFVGREAELREVREALSSTRLLTLTGAGGCGKTRLALQAAAQVVDRYPDGVWWVQLATLAVNELIGSALAVALGVRPLPGGSPLQAAIDHLADSCVLLVLDNCEHLLEAAGEATVELLRGCPQVSVLVTSRARLDVGGETDWRVPSMSLPAELAAELPETLARCDAVRLFVERARKVRPNFAVSSENATAVAQICHELDGIPLAIELAAARTRVMSVEQIASGLKECLRLLSSGARTAPRRQRTLRASMDWSHQLLSPPERLLFRRLAVFAGGWTLDAVERVCAGDGLEGRMILELLSALVDKSLVLVEDHGPAVRYRLLETVRQYALELVAAAGELEAVRDRHLDAYVELAERAESQLVTVRQRVWLDALDDEAGNLRAAIEWAAKMRPETGVRLCAALIVWWRTRGLLSDGLSAFARALQAAPQDVSAARARAMSGQGWLACYAMDGQLAQRSAEKALELGEQLDDPRIQARALSVLGMASMFADPGKAIPILRAGCQRARQANDEYTFADAAQTLAACHTLRDEFAAARSEEAPAYDIAQRAQAGELVAWHWILSAMQSYPRGDLDRCREAADRAIAAAADAGEPVTGGFATGYWGFCAVKTGHADTALDRLVSCRERSLAEGAAMALISLDGGIGLAHASLGRLEEARAAIAANVASGCYGFAYGLSLSLYTLAAIERLRGDLMTAGKLAERARDMGKRVGSAWLASRASVELGRIAATRGSWSEADRSLHDALGSQAEQGHWLDTADTLDWFAEVAAGLESFAEAARLLGMAERVRKEKGMCRFWPERERWEALQLRLRNELGDAKYEATRGEGDALNIQDAITWVRRARGSRKRPSGGWESLTPTELQVIQLVTEGLTNPQIGERMFISRATVKVHLAHVFQKLDVKTRAELSARAARRPD